jgi:hypothetical protein
MFAWGAAPGRYDIRSYFMDQFYLQGSSLLVGTPLEGTAHSFNATLGNPTLSAAAQAKEYGRFYQWISAEAIELPICAQSYVWLHKKGIINAGPNDPSGVADPAFLAEVK